MQRCARLSIARAPHDNFAQIVRIWEFAIAQSAFRFLAPPCQAVRGELWPAARIRVISEADLAIVVQHYTEISCSLRPGWQIQLTVTKPATCRLSSLAGREQFAEQAKDICHMLKPLGLSRESTSIETKHLHAFHRQNRKSSACMQGVVSAAAREGKRGRCCVASSLHLTCFDIQQVCF